MVALTTLDSALTRNHRHLFDRNAKSILHLTVDAVEAFHRSCCVASDVVEDGTAVAAAYVPPSHGLSDSIVNS